jgi:predicted nucleic acid-binding protein
MRWAFKDGSTGDRAYAARVLDVLEETGAIVPVIWSLEVANVLARAERMALFPKDLSDEFIETLNGLTIRPDDSTYTQSLADTLELARKFKLSAYDASYLELALRLRIPLATLDESLLKAAKKAGVKKL